ncbi:unnamed protein product [Dimorphilus gyrociliatus]|uniref:Uncharacterized protein n=1 Tax=Dimorphilus gyrociliatus TaxID=2664684 RepID=A0A7I8VU81_9ANNE|nr:unnamed protein product [Dimorphilus gyrociliatus]
MKLFSLRNVVQFHQKLKQNTVEEKPAIEQSMFTLPAKRSVCGSLARTIPENALPTIEENTLAPLAVPAPPPPPASIPDPIPVSAPPSIIIGNDPASVPMTLSVQSNILLPQDTQPEKNVQDWLGVLNNLKDEEVTLKARKKEERKRKELLRKEEKLKTLVKKKIKKDEQRFIADQKSYEKKRRKLLRKEEKLRSELASQGIYIPPVSETDLEEDNEKSISDFASDDWSCFSSEEEKERSDREEEEDDISENNECIFQTDESLITADEELNDEPKIRIIQHDSSGVARAEKIQPGRIGTETISEKDFEDEDPYYYNSMVDDRMEQVKTMSIRESSSIVGEYRNDTTNYDDDDNENDYYNDSNRSFQKHSVSASEWSQSFKQKDVK